MKRTPTRDLAKNPPVATTPVSYRDANTVYRSLSAVPAQLDVARTAAGADKQFAGKLVGPQAKSPGEVVWAETKHAKAQQSEAHPCPIPLIVAHAPSHALYVESNPVSNVVQAVHELFKVQKVDAVFNDSKFKWKCACYDGETETRFVARLFGVPAKPNFFVLDFQRRSGDPFHFQSVYKAINFRLLKSGFIVCNDTRSEPKIVEEPAFKTFKPLALPDSFFEEDEEDIKYDIEPMLRMCTSPFIDVQREGLAALANQIASNNGARIAAIPFAAKLMEIISLSRDPQVRRLATSAIAKISVEAVAMELVSEKGGSRVLFNLMINDTEVVETRRLAASALLNLASLDAQSTSLLKTAHMPSDARLAQLMCELQAKVGA